MCPRHVGQWAGNCPECSAEKLGRHEPDDVTDDDVLTAKDRALATAARIQQEAKAAQDIDAPLEHEKPPVAPPPSPCPEFIDTGKCGHTDAQHDAMADGAHVHRYKPQRDGELYGKPRYRNTCACGAKEHPPETDGEGVQSDHPETDPDERSTP